MRVGYSHAIHTTKRQLETALEILNMSALRSRSGSVHVPSLQSLMSCSLVMSRSMTKAADGAENTPSENNNTEKAIKYAQERKLYQKRMSELRSAWAAEELSRRAAKDAAQKALIEQQQKGKKQREMELKAKEERRQTTLKQEQQREEEARKMAEIRRMERWRRQSLREDILEAARQERRSQLCKQSASWIAPEELDERIEHALDNPVAFWKEN